MDVIKDTNLISTDTLVAGQRVVILPDGVVMPAGLGGIIGVGFTDAMGSTATASDIREGRIAYSNGQRIVGTKKTPIPLPEPVPTPGFDGDVFAPIRVSNSPIEGMNGDYEFSYTLCKQEVTGLNSHVDYHGWSNGEFVILNFNGYLIVNGYTYGDKSWHIRKRSDTPYYIDVKSDIDAAHDYYMSTNATPPASVTRAKWSVAALGASPVPTIKYVSEE